MNLLFILTFSFLGIINPDESDQEFGNPLEGKIIIIDPGHGGTAETDSYRVGPTGEREEWVNLRVGLILKELLEEKGAKVIITRTEDDNISLSDRAEMAVENDADLFLSIHHNATADPKVNFPIIYFHGNASENKGSVALGKKIVRHLSEQFYSEETQHSLVSDFTIFPRSGSGVLKETYGIPAVIAEASFFTNPAEEERLKQKEHNLKEAQGYLAALEAFFAEPVPPILEKYSEVERLPAFRVFQEAERVNETASLWHQDYLQGKELMKNDDLEFKKKAYELFTRSARSFPDSYVAGDCHRYRSIILEEIGKEEEARNAARRVKEFFVCAESSEHQKE